MLASVIVSTEGDFEKRLFVREAAAAATTAAAAAAAELEPGRALKRGRQRDSPDPRGAQRENPSPTRFPLASS